jgi:Gram-negative bacterial TonB protein C-terminal
MRGHCSCAKRARVATAHWRWMRCAAWRVPITSSSSTVLRMQKRPAATCSPSISATGPEGRLNPDGERALRIALESLARANPPDRRARSATLVELGDWYLIGGNTARAVEAYKEGWTEAVAAGGDAPNLLSSPRRLAYRPPSIAVSRATPSKPDEFEERFVEARFSVGRDGKVTDVSTASTDAPQNAERAVLLAVRKARYAPRLENGDTVDTTGVTLRERVLVRRGAAAPITAPAAEPATAPPVPAPAPAPTQTPPADPAPLP